VFLLIASVAFMPGNKFKRNTNPNIEEYIPFSTISKPILTAPTTPVIATTGKIMTLFISKELKALFLLLMLDEAAIAEKRPLTA
jgi:hypothetical protein